MKLKDGSESLRMKAEMAKRVRAEAERLQLSFLETLYFICVTYFSMQASQSNQTIPKVSSAESTQASTSLEIEAKDDDEDGYVFDMLD